MTEYAYTQNDNEIIIGFYEDEAAKDLSGATKIEIQLFAAIKDPIKKVGPVASWDTAANPTLFDITQLGSGQLTFKPDSAALSGLGSSKYLGRAVVYSVDYPNGIVWARAHDDLFEFMVSR